MKKLCSVEGCERPHDALGYCSMHYQRVRKHGDPHYEVAKKHCTIEGCERRYQSDGYCSMHYRRIQRHGDVTRGRVSRKTQFECSVDDCDNKAIARHLCGKHYARWQAYGDPTITVRDRFQKLRATLRWDAPDDFDRLAWKPVGRGYLAAHWPEHPNANRMGKVAQHTAVMAAKLGRPLRAGESVHHINGIRHDNRPENLELWASAHRPGQRVTDLLAWAHELIEQYRDTPQLWPEHLQP